MPRAIVLIASKRGNELTGSCSCFLALQFPDGKHKLCPSIALQVHLLYTFPIIKPKAGICFLSNNPHFL